MARFTGLLRDLFKAAKPVGPLDAGMRYAGDLFSIAASGTAWAPPEADFGQRAGMMLEEAALGLIPSMGLGGLARHAARRRLLPTQEGKGLRNRPSLSRSEYENKLVQAQQLGEFANLPIQMLMPRKYAQSVYEDVYQQQQGMQPGLLAAEEQSALIDQDQLAMALLASGAMGGSLLGQRDSFSTLRDPFDLRGYSGPG